MAHVESYYLDASLEPDVVAPPPSALQLAEEAFIADRPLNEESIARIVSSQLQFEAANHVVSDYCVEGSQKQQSLENPNLVTMSASILDNQKYFAKPPRVDASHYVWPTDVVTSHHQYAAQSPNIYTDNYMTCEPSDYVYM